MSDERCKPKELLSRLREAVERAAANVQRAREGGEVADDASGASRMTELLGLLVAGAEIPELARVAPGRVAYGARVALSDEETGDEAVFQVMNSRAMDITEAHVSLESPFGEALIGAEAGDVVQVRTPTGPRTYRVVEVITLLDVLDAVERDEWDLFSPVAVRG